MGLPPPPTEKDASTRYTTKKRLVCVLIVVSLLVGALGIWYILRYGVGGLGSFGQTKSILGLDITVVSVTSTDRYECSPIPGAWVQPGDMVAGVGEDLIVVEIQMKNTASSPIGVSPGYAYVVNSYGTQYLSSSYENYAFYEESSLSKQLEKSTQLYGTYRVLPQGTEVRGKEIFRVPENTPGLEMVYHLGVTSYYAEGQVIHGERETSVQEVSWKL